MASFYAELQVAGHTYPVRRCDYSFTQATDARGRVNAKVRHGLVQLLLDVPDDDFLPDWANTPYKPLPGRVVFYETQGRTARETLSWEAGNCVGYREDFQSGSIEDGAYVCHVTITAPKLTMQAGQVSAAGCGHARQPAAGTF
ncbi:type VI secretion system tube protein TssD [uncultured Hymenobacter sp.]|uniref:type VI secretion system tube protein TssD n=1 Tax=uncultured Hymenobacter sp. TaxID=170016 RepID=UPI0035CBB0C5